MKTTRVFVAVFVLGFLSLPVFAQLSLSAKS